MKKLIVLSVILLAASALQGRIIRIPADHATIQKGIDAAKTGDTVLVSPGTYLENINYNGKSITVASLFLTTRDTSYISRTIIDGNKAGTVVTFHLSEKDESVLSGFTITNGSKHFGGGISCISSSPFIEHVTIRNNSNYAPWGVPGSGGGVYCMESSPVLEDVIITGNIAQSGGANGLIMSSSGGGIACYHSSPILTNVSITNNTAANGGGIACFDSNPTLVNVLISDNYASPEKSWEWEIDGLIIDGSGSGSGMYCSGSNPILQNVTIINNTAFSKGGGIFCDNSIPVFNRTSRCSIHSNTALEGNDLFTSNFLEVAVDTFTVFYPHDFYAAPIANFSFDILHDVLVQEDCDLFVSPDGDNSHKGNSADSPLRTIRYAFSIIRADSLHHNSINLLPGTYSPSSNNEVFPVNMPDYVSLAGAGKTEVILDAEGTTRVIQFIRNTSGSIFGMTVRGGLVTTVNGGGIYCLNSTPDITQVIITGNSARYRGDRFGGFYGGGGGGIHCENSSPTLHNVLISNNIAGLRGGGISCSNSSPVLQNVTISGNEAASTTYEPENPGGGGMYCENSGPLLQNVTIVNNTTYQSGGGIFFNKTVPVFDSVYRCNIYLNNALEKGNDLYSESLVKVIVDTFTLLKPRECDAFPLSNFTFDILHGKVVQADADLFVSPDGDDSNRGVSASEPLKTILYASGALVTDSLNPHTIYLMDGTYSPSTNGETFPVFLQDYVSLSGTDQSKVRLDAEGAPHVLWVRGNAISAISGLTVSGATDAGIYLSNSNATLQNVNVTNNTGIGIRIDGHSGPTLRSIIVSDNKGGGISSISSHPFLKDVTITRNSVNGFVCSGSASLQGVTITLNSGTGFTYDGLYTGGLLRDVVISNNTGTYGGGMNISGISPEFSNVLITENDAKYGGGAYTSSSMHGVFVSNNSAIYGGGLYVHNSDTRNNLAFSNLLIANNDAQYGGGSFAMSTEANGNISLKNVTFTENVAEDGGGIYLEKGWRTSLYNTILWNDNPQEVYLTQSTLHIYYSDVQRGLAGITKANSSTVNWNQGNIDSDPLFNGTGDHPYSLTEGSPCIDSGSITTGKPFSALDILGSKRISDGNRDGVAIIDMGAYEFVSGATGVEDFDAQSSALAISIFPNPFSSAATIEYQLGEPGQVNLTIYNNIGQPMANLVNEFRPQGRQQVEWNAEGLAPGIYYFRLAAGGQAVTGRMVKL